MWTNNSAKIKVLFVCHGNICRSPMAESIFTEMAREAGLADRFEVASAATSRDEIGNEPHRGTVQKLAEEGIPLIPHHARQITRQDYLDYDYLIGMDKMNIRNMNRVSGGDPQGKIYKLLDFADIHRDVADPWYTRNFEVTYDDLMVGCRALLAYLVGENPPG